MNSEKSAIQVYFLYFEYFAKSTYQSPLTHTELGKFSCIYTLNMLKLVNCE